MYKISVYNVKHEFLSEARYDEPPTNRDVDILLSSFDTDCFVDICRCEENEYSEFLELDQELDFELEGEFEYVN